MLHNVKIRTSHVEQRSEVYRHPPAPAPPSLSVHRWKTSTSDLYCEKTQEAAGAEFSEWSQLFGSKVRQNVSDEFSENQIEAHPTVLSLHPEL